MAQLTNRRSNRTALQINVGANLAGGAAIQAVFNLTDSKQFNWTGAAPTDSGKDISKFFKKFAIQLTTGASGVDYDLQANVGGVWVACPVGLISSTNITNNFPVATLTSGGSDIITVSLPVHGIQLRLVSASNPTTTTDQTITILMSDSSERADVGRT